MMNKLIELQIYYEIAMAIGESLELDKMLNKALSVYLKKLSCPAGMVIKTKMEGEIYHLEPVVSIPKRLVIDTCCHRILEDLPDDLDERTLCLFIRQLPFNDVACTGNYYHIMELEDFGFLILVRGSAPLSNSIIKSLTPLNKKLARACHACLQNEELNRLKCNFEELATTDRLTGALNRQFFDKKLNEEIIRFGRLRTIFSVIMFDIDNFKDINDKYGHVFGDSVLVNISKCVKGNIRKTDYFVRWGGEEFIILALAPMEGAFVLAEKLRRAIQSYNYGVEGLKVTASFGVVEYEGGMTAEQIVSLADRAMYRAKQRGKNQVERWVSP